MTILPAATADAIDPRPESIVLFNVRISSLTFERLCERLAENLRLADGGYIVTPNVNHICTCYRDPQFRVIYNEAFLALADGTPIIWASHLFGKPLPQKLSGSDMVPRLCEFAALRGHSVYFLGGSPGSAEETARIMQHMYPSLKVAGVDCPEFGFEKVREKNDSVLERIQATKPDLLFVALGAPKQERWMHANAGRLGASISIGVGGTFEFISGRVRRAPHWMQETGMEWLWRLAHEPRRLWRRYLLEDIIFFKLLWLEFRSKRTASSPAGES